MSGIPVLTVSGVTLAEAWEQSLLKLWVKGIRMATEYDREGDPPSLDSTMNITVDCPCKWPMIHKELPGGLRDMAIYELEVVNGVRDHLVTDDPNDTRWEYTYSQRLRSHFGQDQLQTLLDKLEEAPFSRRAQAITWDVARDTGHEHPPCLQSIWCRVAPVPYTDNRYTFNTNVRFRSQDAFKAAMMNLYVEARLHEWLWHAFQLRRSDVHVDLGRLYHVADSYHIYGKDILTVQGRLLQAVHKRTFEDRTFTQAQAEPLMEEAKKVFLKGQEQ